MHPRESEEHERQDEDIDQGVMAADDTGMVTEQREIQATEIAKKLGVEGVLP